MSLTGIEQIAAECGAVIGYTGPGGELAEAAFSRKGLHEFARRLATPKPAADVPLPEAKYSTDYHIDGYGQPAWIKEEVEAYGKAREAAAVDANEGSEQWTKAGAYDMIAEAVENSGVEVNSIVEYVNYLIGLDSAGRADAVPAWFGELPAPISNPEAWPANYAGGYNDALNMCYDVIRGHSPQPMTTQGEAVENVDHFSSLREAVLAFDENPNGQNSTAVIMRARRLTGSQP